jgi:hypothetical protein
MSMKEVTESASKPWVVFNHLTQCYETPDGTSVAAELCDNVECLADVLRIASIRAEQRKAVARPGEEVEL